MAVALAIMLAAAAAAQAQGKGKWLADPKTGCKQFDNDPDPGESIAWSGPCVKGVAEGRGKLDVFVKGKLQARYEGDMKNGRVTGQGTLRLADGSEAYQGGFLDGRRHGHGVNTWEEGHRYEGDYVNDVRTGHGVETWPDGSRFEGEYLNDVPNGAGTLVRKSGTFTGNWVKGCFREGNRMTAVGTTLQACGFSKK